MSSDPTKSPDQPPEDADTEPPPEKVTPPAESRPVVLSDSSATFTRAAALWSALFVGFVVLIVLLIFIAQNTESAQFAFLGWNWSLPLGVAILGAAVCGGLVTAAAGTVRIHQLRRAAKKNLKAGT